MDWTCGELLAAVRSSLGWGRPSSSWTYERADLDGDQLLVVFRIKDHALVRPVLGAQERFGVHYSLTDLPHGANTGIPHETPERWAEEIGIDIDEQVDTGGLARAARPRTGRIWSFCGGAGDTPLRPMTRYSYEPDSGR